MNRLFSQRSVLAAACISAFILVSSGTGDIRAEQEPEAPVAATLSQVNFWSDGKDDYYQYDVTLTNQSDDPVTDWTMAIDVAEDTKVSQFWNCAVSMEDGVLTLVPADYTKTLEKGASSQGIGLIISTAEPEAWNACTVTLLDGTGTERIVQLDDCSQNSVQNVNDPQGSSTPTSDRKGSSSSEGTDPQNNSNSLADAEEKDSERVGDMADESKVFKALDQVNVPVLHVEGTRLMDEENKPVRLQGISTHGLGVFPDYVSEEAFRTLRDDFGANVIRLALYTQVENGYCDGDERRREQQEELIDKGVKACEALGMYVIIDWHILSDGNPLIHADEAEDFFRRMSEKYADVPNVIYEICNEPNGSSWEAEIKPYAQRIIPVIRENSPESIVLVGTNTWSQDVNDAAADPLDFDNIMYCLHFYAGTHKDDLRNKLISVLDQGVPVFISECSICDASGNGGVDYNSADAWMKLIAERGLSFIEWNLSNKDETSAIVVPSCTKLSGWTESELSETALWYREQMRGLAGM